LAEVAGGFMGKYLHRRRHLGASGRSCVAVESGVRRLAYRGEQAKRLRLLSGIYARYGGMPPFVVPAKEPVKKSSQFPANCDSMEMLAETVFEG
jgi:hypothetical protein